MIIVNLVHMGVSTFRLFFILRPIGQMRIHPNDKVLLVVHAICFIDVLIRMNTGYVNSKQKTVVMIKSRILW